MEGHGETPTDKWDVFAEAAHNLLSMAAREGAGAQPLCAKCGLTGYEHVDHKHEEHCHFGDCGKFRVDDDTDSASPSA